MKLLERVLDVDSTLQGEKIAMSIDTSSLAKIIGILTDLYADPELAVIREYSTNAFDAHVEAGVTRPIEVTTPTQLAPFFRVRDYGFGLDVTDIREIYSQYGRSTKTDSDDVVGMLGLGCKSALTYTDQFTLRGVKNGICTLVSISRDEDGGGSMTIVDEYETDEPSGVEVVVPAKNYNKFETKSRDFFRFWTPGSVIVDGKEPTRVDGTWISDDLLLTKETSQSYVVMGNVAYPMPDEVFSRWNAPKVVAFVDIGMVHFVPSREALQLDAQTKHTLELIKKEAQEKFNGALLKAVEEAESYQDAIQKMYEGLDMGMTGEAKYKGETVPGSWTVGDGDDAQRFILVANRKPRYDKGWSRDRTVATKTDVFWLTGYDGADFTPYKRQKLRQWADSLQGVRLPGYYILCDKLPQDQLKWIDQSRVYDWQLVKDQKIVRERTVLNNGRPSGSYEGWVDGKIDYSILAADIDTTKPIYFYNKTWSNPRDALVILKARTPDATIIMLPSNRINKFKRDFPMATEVTETVRKMANDWMSGLTKTQKLMLAIQDHPEVRSLSRFDHKLIDDPALASVAKAAKMNRPEVTKAYNEFSQWINLDKQFENPLPNYPLYSERTSYDKTLREHMILYFNAAFAARQEG